MANETTRYTGGVGFGGLLTVLFVGLKLTGYIHWSWLWVLSPLWIGLLVAVTLIVAILGVAFIVASLFGK